MEHRKIYLAGSMSEINRAGYPYLLQSFYYTNDKAMEKIALSGRKIFLDSGAFSAFTKGAVIDINKYIDFIHRWKDSLAYVAALDVIGDAEEGKINYTIMTNAGVGSIPCFHYGEDFSYLTHYSDTCDYIAIGGIAMEKGKARTDWLDSVWKALSGYTGKVHCFGVTSPNIMLGYPWHSVDSTAWAKAAGKGFIILPETGEHFRMESYAGQTDYDTIGKLEREKIDSLIVERGHSIDALRSSNQARIAWNIQATRELMAIPCRYKQQPKGLFD
jgi:hypothetical protein